MEFRQLGGSGLKVPVLSFGTGTFGGRGEFFKEWGNSDVTEATRLVDICLEAGISTCSILPTFISRGASEEILGKAIAGRPQCGADLYQGYLCYGRWVPTTRARRANHLIPACEASLKRLNTDYNRHLPYARVRPGHAGGRSTRYVEHASGKRQSALQSPALIFSGWHLMNSLSVSEKYGWSRLCRPPGFITRWSAATMNGN